MEDSAKKHWQDPEIQKIREAFLKYVTENFDPDYDWRMKDQYIGSLCRLLGVEMGYSDDGYDKWWELSTMIINSEVAAFFKDIAKDLNKKPPPTRDRGKNQ